ncbi:CPBP family intramembrane glutamic endopeptidase [Myceligenerans crystallogenes]|uniref:CAAX prenyl protease 2/Lysostaphin resistance protein A-like domain-containing protein n=1 Tax=Myceligenerans crystallogenes TaxID=316335 RepID=A0ABP4ZGB1_9MICO
MSSSLSPAAASSSAAPGTAPGTAPRLGLGPFGIACRVVVAVVILLAANLGANLVLGVVALVPGVRAAVSGQSPWAFVFALGMQVLVLVLVALAVQAWMRWIERGTMRDIGWRWDRRSVVWLLLGIAVAAGSVVVVTAALPDIAPPPGGAALLGEQEAHPAVIAGLVVHYLGLAFLQQGLPEELLFRGWLLWRLRHRPVTAVVVTTLAFTVIHLVSNGGQESAWERVLYLALPLGFALLAVGLLLWTGSLWAAVGVHGGFHVGNYLATALLPQADAVTSWLAIGGVQAGLGLALTVTALRSGRRILGPKG